MTVSNENLSKYEMEALLYAEKYGIVEYKVDANLMIWSESFPSEGTFRHEYNMDTKEEDVSKVSEPKGDDCK